MHFEKRSITLSNIYITHFPPILYLTTPQYVASGKTPFDWPENRKRSIGIGNQYIINNKKAKKMVKIKQQKYTEPTVKVVAFIVEKGFQMSGHVFENIDKGQDISGNDNDPNALVRWQ